MISVVESKEPEPPTWPTFMTFLALYDSLTFKTDKNWLIYKHVRLQTPT